MHDMMSISCLDNNTTASSGSCRSRSDSTGESRNDTDSDKSSNSSSSSTTKIFNGCRLYVSNLPYKMRGSDLSQVFARCGFPVINSEIIYGQSGSKGYGFVTLTNRLLAARARALFDHSQIDERTIKVDYATDKRPTITTPTTTTATVRVATIRTATSDNRRLGKHKAQKSNQILKKRKNTHHHHNKRQQSEQLKRTTDSRIDSLFSVDLGVGKDSKNDYDHCTLSRSLLPVGADPRLIVNRPEGKSNQNQKQHHQQKRRERGRNELDKKCIKYHRLCRRKQKQHFCQTRQVIEPAKKTPSLTGGEITTATTENHRLVDQSSGSTSPSASSSISGLSTATPTPTTPSPSTSASASTLNSLRIWPPAAPIPIDHPALAQHNRLLGVSPTGNEQPENMLDCMRLMEFALESSAGTSHQTLLNSEQHLQRAVAAAADFVPWPWSIASIDTWTAHLFNELADLLANQTAELACFAQTSTSAHSSLLLAAADEAHRLASSPPRPMSTWANCLGYNSSSASPPIANYVTPTDNCSFNASLHWLPIG